MVSVAGCWLLDVFWGCSDVGYGIPVPAGLGQRGRDDQVQDSERLNISPAEAEKKILSGDENRASYYNYYSAKTWGQADSYHLCINSSILGLEDTTEFIKEFIKKKLNL